MVASLETEDHPLLTPEPGDAKEYFRALSPTPAKNASRPKPSFKSNLTASFQALRNKARSWSNFNAPSLPSDDLLDRSVPFHGFRSEMRPRPIQGTPTPALRRYLNPIANASIIEHLALDPNDSRPMVQMQTFERRRVLNRVPKRRGISSLPEPNTEAGCATAAQSVMRQREPRENSDFLRVIVMEMNMRKVGKLDPKAAGKARLALPARRPCVKSNERGKGVPPRWVPVSACY